MPERRIAQHWQRTGPGPLQKGAQARHKLDRTPTVSNPKANYARKRWAKLPVKSCLIESSVEACRLAPTQCPKKVRTALNRRHKTVEYNKKTYTQCPDNVHSILAIQIGDHLSSNHASKCLTKQFRHELPYRIGQPRWRCHGLRRSAGMGS